MRLGALAIAATLAAVSAAAPGFAQPAPIVTATIPAKRKKGLFNGKAQPVTRFVFNYPRKDRMKTAAQHKRASRKARNVAKHRRHA